ncbi:trans-sulfuration enzyme family protein [Archangium sp.]|uniref:trans-sulfuration enzyme family protein n=1 Tax=Archangium sp. TaxID=1872627 RepID=UPI00389AF600
MSNKRKTVAVHAGSQMSSKAQPVVPAIHVSAVSYFDNSDELDAALDGKDYVYSRIAAPNAALLEEAVAAMEGTEACVAYASGMAALRAVFDAQNLKAGDVVVMPADGYGVTRSLFKNLAARTGARIEALILSDASAPERIVALRPKLVMAESVTNPLLRVPDLRALSRACREVGAALAVDGTFPSPYGQRACELGADYAIQSTTKWLNGHSDALGGTVSGTREKLAALKAARLFNGDVLGPFEAWLTLRGVRTLPVRMKAHCEHAAHVAKRLSESSLIERVHYPGLPGHPDYQVATQVLEGGFGGMVAFDIRGAGRPDCFRFLEAVKLARAAPSLGDVCTLVMHAASASARRMTPEERQAAGIGESLIRVSVGLEDPDDIADDLIAAVAEAMKR